MRQHRWLVLSVALALLFDAEPLSAGSVVSGDAKVFEPNIPDQPLATAEVGITGAGFWRLDGASLTNTDTLIGEQSQASGEVVLRNGATLDSTNALRVGLRGQGLLSILDGSVLFTGSLAHLPNGSYPLNATVGSPLGGRAIVSGGGSLWSIEGALGVGAPPNFFGNSQGQLTVNDGARVTATAVVVDSRLSETSLYVGADDPHFFGDEAQAPDELSSVEGQEVVYVGLSNRGYAEISNAGRLIGGNLQVGYLFGARGLVDASGSDARIDMRHYISIGQAGFGTLRLSDDAQLKTENDEGLFLGAGGGAGKLELLRGATAEVGFLGAGGYGFVDFDVVGGGLGEVYVESGASLFTKTAHLGYLLDGQGVVTVGIGPALFNADAAWNNEGLIAVGLVGKGSVDINYDGIVATDDMLIGGELGSTGRVELHDGAPPELEDDRHAQLEVHGLLEVGRHGSATLKLGSGAEVSADNVVVGSGAGRDIEPARIDLIGNGALLTVADTLTIGRAADRIADLTIAGDGRVSAHYALLGELADSDGTLDLTDAFTTAAFDTLEVAQAGRGRVSVDEAELTAGELRMGTEASGLAELDVRGLGGAVITTYLAIIGGAATGDLHATLPFAGATVQITQGGSFKAPLAVIGREVGGTGFLAVSDESSQLTIDGNLYVGDHGTGALLVTDHAAARAFNLLAGHSSDSQGNVIQILDHGYLDTDGLSIGEAGEAELDIKDAEVFTDFATFGVEAGSHGALTVAADEGQARLTAGTAIIGDAGLGEARIEDAEFLVNDLHIGASAGGDGALFTSVGAQLHVVDRMTVGESGLGKAFFFGRSEIDSGDTDVGLNSGGDGRVELGLFDAKLGERAAWVVNGLLRVGVAGRGKLQFDHALLNAPEVVLGVEDGGFGHFVAHLDNGAALLIHRLTVGDAGAGQFMLDGEGGLAQIDELMIGASTGGDGTVEINSPLATSVLTVGGAGAALFTLRDTAGALHTDSAVIGELEGSDGVMVIDELAEWRQAGSLHVGQGGAGALELRDGSEVTVDGNLELGSEAHGDGEVTLHGGRLVLPSMATIGLAGGGALRVNEGGVLVASADLALAQAEDSQGELTIVGAGSEAQVAGEVRTLAGDGSVFVSDHGLLTATRVQLGDLQGSNSAARGALEVRDSGRVDARLGIAMGGPGRNVLTVADGGVVTTEALAMGLGSASASGETRNFGDISNAGLVVVGGQLRIGAGSAAKMRVHDAGRLEATGVLIGEDDGDGATSGGALLVAGADASVAVHESINIAASVAGSLLKISDAGVVTVDGDVTVSGSARDGASAKVVVEGQDSRLSVFGPNGILIGGSGPASVQLRDGGILEATAVHLLAKGVLNGDGGTLYGDVMMEGGTLAPGNSPGLMTFSDTIYLFDGTLAIEIGGRERGTEYDAIDVDTMVLGGTLEVSRYDLGNGFAVAPGDEFDIIHSHGLAGDFAGFIFTGFDAGLSWTHGLIDLGNGDVVYRLSVSGSAVPLPGSALLLSGAIVMIGMRVRRRQLRSAMS